VAWTWFQRHPRVVDVAFFLVALATALGHAARHRFPAAGVPLALVETLPLLFRRRNPLAVLAVTAGATVAVSVGWSFYNPIPAGFALFTVAVMCDRQTSLRAGVLTLAAVGVPVWIEAGWTNWFGAAGRLLGFTVAWVVGDSLGTRQRYLETLESRTRAEEQARIARELHDVIAHNVSVMVVQAAAANDVFDARPERAREALHAIEASGRQALGELRSLLGAVRDGTTWEPQPGLDRLDELVAQVRAAGLPVTVQVDGSPGPLPTGIDLSAYRIVQEALTNALKHAGGDAHASVRVAYGPDSLELEIADDGAGSPVTVGGGGHGLVGMRERVALYSGRFEAARRSGGGFAVRVLLPIR